MVNRAITAVRRRAPPIHWIGAAAFAVIFFLYIRLVALTARLWCGGIRLWPDLPRSCVLALWHASAPSLLVAIAARRPSTQMAIMVACDPRGDYLALLCRFLGVHVIRGEGARGGWAALLCLAREIELGACAAITADGSGPARVAKVGAVALASAARVPLLTIGVDCSPAIVQRQKWDAPRNPLPFSRVAVAFGETLDSPMFQDWQSIEDARYQLQQALNEASAAATRTLTQAEAKGLCP